MSKKAKEYLEEFIHSLSEKPTKTELERLKLALEAQELLPTRTRQIEQWITRLSALGGIGIIVWAILDNRFDVKKTEADNAKRDAESVKDDVQILYSTNKFYYRQNITNLAAIEEKRKANSLLRLA